MRSHTEMPPARTDGEGRERGSTPLHRPPADLDVRVLGAFEVRVDGQDLADGLVGRSRSIFQYLLLAGGSVSRDVLIGAFWPDFDLVRGRNNLNVAVSGVRRALGDAGRSIVQHRSGRYRVNPELRVRLDLDDLMAHLRIAHERSNAGDVHGAISAFESAAATYRGDLLPEDPYADWLSARRTFVRHAYLDALQRLADLYRADGRLFEASRACQLGLLVDDLDEETMERWFRCLSERKAQRQLATAWADYRDRLARTLGSAPSARLVDLAAAAPLAAP